MALSRTPSRGSQKEGPFTLLELCTKTHTERTDSRTVNRLCSAARLLGWTKKRARHPDTGSCLFCGRDRHPQQEKAKNIPFMKRA